MIRETIPQVKLAHIGGSATWNCVFPEEINYPGIEVIEAGMQFQTPFGVSAPIKLFKLNGKLVLDIVFHGWNGLSPYDENPTERVLWVLREAGVKYIIADGTVGAINPLLELGDVIVPSDFIDYTKRHYNIGRFTNDIVRSQNIVSSYLQNILYKEAKSAFGKVFRKGTYGVYECPRLETPAEMQRFYNDRCDVIGHTMMPEAILARCIGAEYAPLYLISSVAAGLSGVSDREWFDDPITIGRVILSVLDTIDVNREPDTYQRIPVSNKLLKHITWEE